MLKNEDEAGPTAAGNAIGFVEAARGSESVERGASRSGGILFQQNRIRERCAFIENS